MLEVDLILLVGLCLLESRNYGNFHSAFLEALSLALQPRHAGSKPSICPMGKIGHIHGTPHHSNLINFSFLQWSSSAQAKTDC